MQIDGGPSSTLCKSRQSLPNMGSSILREIAELSNPKPLDFDPEDISRDYESSEEDGEDGEAGREHYVQVKYVLC